MSRELDVRGILRSLRVALAATSASTGPMSKSTCVDFAAYTSPTWYCNRYTTEGTHVYRHSYIKPTAKLFEFRRGRCHF